MVPVKGRAWLSADTVLPVAEAAAAPVPAPAPAPVLLRVPAPAPVPVLAPVPAPLEVPATVTPLGDTAALTGLDDAPNPPTRSGLVLGAMLESIPDGGPSPGTRPPPPRAITASRSLMFVTELCWRMRISSDVFLPMALSRRMPTTGRDCGDRGDAVAVGVTIAAPAAVAGDGGSAWPLDGVAGVGLGGMPGFDALPPAGAGDAATDAFRVPFAGVAGTEAGSAFAPTGPSCAADAAAFAAASAAAFALASASSCGDGTQTRSWNLANRRRSSLSSRPPSCCKGTSRIRISSVRL